MPISAVFLDRDGVLNAHLPGAYVQTPEDLVIPTGVAQAVRRLNDSGFPVIVISNQQGVGKGIMTQQALDIVDFHLKQSLHNVAGAKIDSSYYCTDLHQSLSPRRKPEPGMLLEAASDFGLTLPETVFVGDSATDIAAGRNAGVGQTILLLSGATREYREGDFMPAPDLVFADLPQAVDWILENSK